MSDRPPPLGNGYLWLAHTLLPAAKARLLEEHLHGLRHELRTRDHSGLGDPRHDTEIELWVHPADEARAGAALNDLLAGE